MPPATLYLQKLPARDLARTCARFALKPNAPGSKGERYWIGYLVAALFLLAAHLVFTRVLHLAGLSYLMAQTPVILIMLNVAYFLRRYYVRQHQLVLQIDELEVRLFRGPQLLYAAFLSDLDVVREGSCVVCIKGLLFPGFSIGKPNSGAAYRLSAEGKWGELVEWFK